MTVDDAGSDLVDAGEYAPVVIDTSALSFEPLCKLNDGNSRKDL